MFEFFVIVLIFVFVTIYSAKENSPKNLTNILYSSEVEEQAEVHEKVVEPTVPVAENPNFTSDYDYIDMSSLDDDFYDDDNLVVKDISEELLSNIKESV